MGDVKGLQDLVDEFAREVVKSCGMSRAYMDPGLLAYYDAVGVRTDAEREAYLRAVSDEIDRVFGVRFHSVRGKE